MGNDLISRSALIENFFKIETPYRPSQINEVLNLINEQPTAYDIDKVKKELKEEINYDFTDKGNGYFEGIVKAIEIVKAGGKQ